MATSKTFTATDIQQGIMYLHPVESGNLRVQQNYRFVGTDPLFDDLEHRVIDLTVAWSSLPQNVKDALTTINNHLYNQILAREGME